jgi:hypothetical protein
MFFCFTILLTTLRLFTFLATTSTLIPSLDCHEKFHRDGSHGLIQSIFPCPIKPPEPSPWSLTNVPECFDPFEFLPGVLSVVEVLSEIENMDELYEKKEAIPELRYLDDIEKYLGKTGYPLPIHFDWFTFYMHLDEEKYVPDIAFREFKNYLHELFPYLIEVIGFISEQYKTIGRIELL